LPYNLTGSRSERPKEEVTGFSGICSPPVPWKPLKGFGDLAELKVDVALLQRDNVQKIADRIEGRRHPDPVLEVSGVSIIVKGIPVRSVRTPDVLQPQRKPLTTAGACERRRLPLPNGSS